MKKLITIIFLILCINPCYASSIFSKKEEYTVNKEIPFFINIYSDGDDVNADFDDQQMVLTPQIHFFNKKIEDSVGNTNNFFISARRSKTVSGLKKETDKIELITDYKYGKWELKSGVSQEAISGINQYYNYISFEPSYKVNEKISLFGGVSHSLTSNYDQTKLGFKYTPYKFKRLEFEFSISNYTKQFGSYRQKLNLDANLKI